MRPNRSQLGHGHDPPMAVQLTRRCLSSVDEHVDEPKNDLDAVAKNAKAALRKANSD